tara:strand:+ start:1772 stop:2506 length:735 start_codon:yes stop_codon:yes gene_type:complete
MILPKLDTPTYELNLISTGKPVRYRPFLVKEQKMFLMSAESEDTKELITTIRNVLKNCLLDEVDVDNLPSFDLEYLFMNLRARSVEEVVNLKYKCNNNVKNEEGEEKKCNHIVEFDVNILEIEPTTYDNHTDKIQINEKVGIRLKYPTFEMFQKYDNLDQSEAMLQVLVDCIDYIYDEEQMYYSKDSTRKELEEFIDNLQQKDLEKFKDFFNTMPELKKDLNFDCPKCEHKETITVKGMQNFFV